MLSYWQDKAGQENSDYWTREQFDYQKQRDAVADEQWAQEFALAQQKAASSSSSGSSSDSSGSGYSSDTKAIQKKLNAMGANLDVDGVWGPATQAAYEKYMGGNWGNITEFAESRDGYNDVMEDVKTLRSNGENSQTINSVINQAIRNGTITAQEGVLLRKSYVGSR